MTSLPVLKVYIHIPLSLHSPILTPGLMTSLPVLNFHMPASLSLHSPVLTPGSMTSLPVLNTHITASLSLHTPALTQGSMTSLPALNDPAHNLHSPILTPGSITSLPVQKAGALAACFQAGEVYLLKQAEELHLPALVPGRRVPAHVHQLIHLLHRLNGGDLGRGGRSFNKDGGEKVKIHMI